jgi:7-carboxy-7-deazaguanine synthase
VRITEIFYSIQGEGSLVGVPSAFIRTTGCNLRCSWCDTPYTSWRPTGKELTLPSIISQIRRFPTNYVVVTGGEPLIADGIEELAKQLIDQGRHLTIETAGTIFKPLPCSLVSLSPKLSNSTPWNREHGQFARMHEERRLNLGALQAYVTSYPYQLKFVVEEERDFEEIQEILEQLRNVDRRCVLVMPQGVTAKKLKDEARWIVERCKDYGFRYTPRLQIELYGNKPGR